ncbi:MAG TPA: hypothetical protein VIY08_06305 [Candidatus Nitrosocosmicus sp.]
MGSEEQHIPGPVDKDRRKINYSDKKKKHLVRTRLTANNPVINIYKTGYRKG